ncbi:head decoration protein [Hansschlegelia zhihuaiae]|uniref:Head decoration protein n=1 Tax=Hansschlegelia zhihuaiae TaxID=405005 RepID=A0A4Q0M4D8_9HYPH|nr:head decoration protein [Hansschlegelia zhihuaiae]RXF67693.1 head decoration protein [Hansschlegelia zhihuaiae]
MPLLETAVVASDWLKHEADNYRSRSTGTLASGQGKLKSGAVLAQLSASSKWVVAAASGSDGSQTAKAILLFAADATDADVPIVFIDDDAIVSHNGLTWGSTINDATKRAAAIAQLRAQSIKVREGA